MKEYLIRFRKSPVLNLVHHENGEGKSRVERGAVIRAHIRSYTRDGIEMADLHLEDGTVAVAVPFEVFQFIDEDR